MDQPIISIEDKSKLEPVKELETFETKAMTSSPEKAKQIAKDWKETLTPEENLDLFKSLTGEPETNTLATNLNTESRVSRGVSSFTPKQESLPNPFEVKVEPNDSLMLILEKFLSNQT